MQLYKRRSTLGEKGWTFHPWGNVFMVDDIVIVCHVMYVYMVDCCTMLMTVVYVVYNCITLSLLLSIAKDFAGFSLLACKIMLRHRTHRSISSGESSKISCKWDEGTIECDVTIKLTTLTAQLLAPAYYSGQNPPPCFMLVVA